MELPIRLISTDFDGTLFAEFEQPPVPESLQRLIATLQARGAKWVINTGRDMSSLQEAIARAHLSVRPDFLVLVERLVYRHDQALYLADDAWNEQCQIQHARLFHQVRQRLPEVVQWINERFAATIYEDAFSPFCLIADNNEDADRILTYLEEFCLSIPNLTIMRNDVYARMSHAAFTKGTALQEIARQLGVGPDTTLAAGDHYNDLPMLSTEYAQFLVAPSNAVEAVKLAVTRQGGWVSDDPRGEGVRRGLEWFLDRAGYAL